MVDMDADTYSDTYSTRGGFVLTFFMDYQFRQML